MNMERSSGVGVVYSYIVLHHDTIPGFANLLPLTIVLVEFEGGCRIPARYVGELDRATLVGSRVRAEFELIEDSAPALLVRLETDTAD
ncbi:OB-fold domain-containing protein [Rhodococcus sp. 14C212]|uniref:Zn-ribbon domain-containing OB-fold protein n=1 Tax=Rhodococcus sp. 14C212 TaxID=2711209 RepID=UPI001F0CFB8D|nr:OB-fold domain-containing protein [Rhodococcus sp. 14C212]